MSTDTKIDDNDDHVKKVKVYTKTGDKGTTQLYNMQRLSKTADYFHALGDTDELNAHVGLAREYSSNTVGIDDWLVEIQSRLLDAGSCIATPLSSSPENRIHRVKFPEDSIAQLEEWIDKMEESLPPLTNFILPSGGLAASSFHVCRTVTRRAERRATALVEQGELDEVVMRYLNRLSDFFFVAARYAAHKEGKPEVIYKKAVDRSRRVSTIPPNPQ